MGNENGIQIENNINLRLLFDIAQPALFKTLIILASSSSMEKGFVT